MQRAAQQRRRDVLEVLAGHGGVRSGPGRPASRPCGHHANARSRGSAPPTDVHDVAGGHGMRARPRATISLPVVVDRRRDSLTHVRAVRLVHRRPAARRSCSRRRRRRCERPGPARSSPHTSAAEVDEVGRDEPARGRPPARPRARSEVAVSTGSSLAGLVDVDPGADDDERRHRAGATSQSTPQTLRSPSSGSSTSLGHLSAGGDAGHGLDRPVHRRGRRAAAPTTAPSGGSGHGRRDRDRRCRASSSRTAPSRPRPPLWWSATTTRHGSAARSRASSFVEPRSRGDLDVRATARRV